MSLRKNDPRYHGGYGDIPHGIFMALLHQLTGPRREEHALEALDQTKLDCFSTKAWVNRAKLYCYQHGYAFQPNVRITQPDGSIVMSDQS